MCKELTKTIKLQNVHNTIEDTETNLEVLMPEFFKGLYKILRLAHKHGFFNTITLLSNYFAKCVATICECKVQ